MGIYRRVVRATPWWMRTNFRHVRPLYWLCALEFPFTVASLALYGIADPDTYRTALWTEGANLGWNSDPIEILYSFANYKPMQPPTPWNQFITDYNVVVCVLAMFILLAKTVAYILHFLPPVFSAFLHAALTSLWAYSITQQVGSDYSDPAHPSKYPWMFTHGCGPPVIDILKGFCMQAQASLAVATLQCTLASAFMGFSLVMSFPTQEQREQAKREQEEEQQEEYDDKRVFELGQWPASPGSPMFPMTPTTPRTRAFQTLDGTLNPPRTNRDLPLRQHIAMDNKETR